MSEYYLNDFVTMCDCFIQFREEYPCKDNQEDGLFAFCEFVKANKPFQQLKEQLNAFVMKHHKHLATGITVCPNDVPEPGAIFEQEDVAIEIRGAGGQPYRMDFAYLCWSILEREKGRRDNDRRKNPKDVCMYCLSVISKCLRAISNDAPLDRKVRQSIQENTKPRSLDSLSAPYSQVGLENLRNLGVKFIRRHEESINGLLGQGAAPKVAAVVKDFNAANMMESNVTGRIADAIARTDDVALESVIRDTAMNFVNNAHKTADRGNPNDQL